MGQGGMNDLALPATDRLRLECLDPTRVIRHVGAVHSAQRNIHRFCDPGLRHTVLAEQHHLVAKAAGAGELLNIHDLKAAYEQTIGHSTGNSTIYNLLARRGWRKRKVSPAGCRQTWLQLAHHVRR
jgi:hypothetical protein